MHSFILPVDGHMGSFQVFRITNNAAVNIVVRGLLCLSRRVSLETAAGVGLLG